MSRVLTLIGTALVLALVITYAATSDLFVTSDKGTASADGQSRAEPRARVKLSELRPATTATRFPGAPLDSSPQAATDGLVVRPLQMLKVFKEPTGRAFAKMPPKQFGDTWLPVIDRRAGWVRVLLPSRPNGATGWLRKSGVELATSPYLLRVHLGSRTIDINYQGDSIGTWPVAVGKPATPTPTGRTFLLGSVVDDDRSYSPVILPLGSHSDTLDTYGGGPGTVAFHGWPDTSVFGSAVSHGCIRVPAEALNRLTQVPLGTLVIVDDN